MCKKNVLTIAAVAILALATSANARIIVEEQFIYEPVESNINTKDGGIGFDGAWVSTISHGRIYWIVEGLSFSTLPVAGNALSRYGSAGRAEAHRLLSTASRTALTADNTTIWFSQLLAGTTNYRNAMFVFGTEPFAHTPGYQLAAPGDGFGLLMRMMLLAATVLVQSVRLVSITVLKQLNLMRAHIHQFH